jgi:hypothetical protein
LCADSLTHRTASSGQINQLGLGVRAPVLRNGLAQSNSSRPRPISGGRNFITGNGSYSSYTSFLNGKGGQKRSETSYSYVDLRPPRVDPVTAQKRCIQSADYKIQSELREMQQREEELR